MVQGAVLQKKEGINNKEREKNLKISKFALLIVLLLNELRGDAANKKNTN